MQPLPIHSLISNNPNPQIEMRIRVQAIDVHSEFKKDNVTLLVMRPFLSLLGASRAYRIFYLGIRE